MYRQLSNIIAEDSVIIWRKYQGENLMLFFSDEDWHRIFPDVFSYERLVDFFSWSTGVAFVAYDKKSNTPFAFLYIYIEDAKKQVVSIHGGGWQHANHLLHYRSLFLMLEALLSKNIKIHTSCIPNNFRAYRFLRSAGFIKYMQTENYIYFWLSAKKMRKSPIYQKFIN
jgi:hypothetical protein